MRPTLPITSVLLGFAILVGHAGCLTTSTNSGSGWGADGSPGSAAELPPPRPDSGAPGSPAKPPGESWGAERLQARPDSGALEPDAAPSTCVGLDPSSPAVLYLSSDDSNSMASPAIVRHFIESRGGLVNPAEVRTYEFLNYYNVRYQVAEAGTLRIVPQLRRLGTSGDVELQIGVQAPAPAATRPPLTLTLVLDTSGSMNGTPISLLSRSIKALATRLRAGDIVSAVTWSTSQTVPMSGHVVTGPNDPAVLALADGMRANGGTDLSAGLQRGYALARQHQGQGRINRVMLISDGGANVGVTDEKLIGDAADVQNKEGIYLVGVGVGEGLNDVLMNVVTDAGNGAYVYLDTPQEADKMLGSRFDEVLGVAARHVEVKLTLPWYFKMLEFHGEEYSTEPAKVKPQDLAPGDAMVFHQTLRACEATRIEDADAIAVQATWKDPLTFLPNTAQVSQTMSELLAGQDAELRRGRAIVAYAEALKAVGRTGSRAERAALLDKAAAVVDEADPGRSDPELGEIRGLIARYKSQVAQ